MKKNYKEFEKVYIGASDIAALTLRSVHDLYNLKFNSDGAYQAYEAIGNDVEIGSHYEKKFTGKTWLKIFDDAEKVYDAYHYGLMVDVYRAGDFGCIIHWHQ